jgi:hypothetical protein
MAGATHLKWAFLKKLLPDATRLLIREIKNVATSQIVTPTPRLITIPVMLMPSGSLAADGRIDSMLNIKGETPWGLRRRPGIT